MSDHLKFSPGPYIAKRLRSVGIVALILVLFFLFLKSGLREQASVENIRLLGANPLAPVIVVAAMTGAWAFALPASVFFFITPLLFPPLMATGIVCAGSAAGSALGYLAARHGIGPWVQRFDNSRVTRFLSRHSTFSSLFAIRVLPSSPHMIINYAAGIVRVPFWKFLAASVVGIGLKAFLYATAIDAGVMAPTLQGAMNWQTLSALSVLSALGIGGHFLQKRWMREEETSK